jgi:hypothetical protein
METLLNLDFINHYNRHGNLPVPGNAVSKSTQETYFELTDDDVMIYSQGQGVAKYDNPTQKTIFVINYERFVTPLPPRVKNSIGKGMCDLIVYTDDEEYFLLNELTDTIPEYVVPHDNINGRQPGKRVKAQSQLLQSLKDLMAVSNISQFI